jgi:ribonuclease HII
MKSWLVGIDEVGRGPLAGPVMVGAALVPADFDWALLPGVTDSKKLTEKKREAIFANALDLQQAGKLWFAVTEESAAKIDAIGIVPSIRSALARALTAVVERSGAAPAALEVLLDGGLTAPAEYLHQQTIIKGDATEPVIGLASIVAKVTRDRLMIQFNTQYPGYGLEVHKGYGTVAHRAAIRERGLSAIHRVTFCRGCQ